MKRTLKTTTAILASMNLVVPLPALAQATAATDQARAQAVAACAVDSNSEECQAATDEAVAQGVTSDEIQAEIDAAADTDADANAAPDAPVEPAAPEASAEAGANAEANAEADPAAPAEPGSAVPSTDELEQNLSEAGNAAEDAAADAEAQATDTANEAEEQASEAVSEAEEQASEAAEDAQEQAVEAAEDAEATATDTADSATQGASGQVDADVAGEADANANAEAQTSAEAEADTEADAEAETGGESADGDLPSEEDLREDLAGSAETEADAEATEEQSAETEAGTDGVTSIEEETSADTSTATDADTSADAEATADADAEASADTDVSADADAEAGADAEADADAETGADAETDAEADTEAEAEAETGATEQTDAEEQALAGETPVAAAAAEDAEVVDTVTDTVTEEEARSSTEDFETDISREPTAQTGAGAQAQAQTQSESDDDDDGLSDLEKALLVGAGALAVGAFLSNNRQVVASSNDRVVVSGRDGGYELIKDDNALLRQAGAQVETQTYDDGSTRTIISYDDGSQIVTIRDANLRVLRRERITPDGERIVLINDLNQDYQPVDVSQLQPAQQQSRTVDLNDEQALRNALAVDRNFDRAFSLSQVRNIAEVRQQVPAIDLEAITFDTGSAAIRPEQADELRELGQYIRQTIEEDPNAVFLVEGHTDAVGNAAYNLALSDRRAESVALALDEYFDVPASNLVVQGYGERFLKVPTQDAERTNRRASVRDITPLLQVAAAN